MKAYLEVKEATGTTYTQDLGNLPDEIITTLETSVRGWKDSVESIVEVLDVAGNVIAINKDQVVSVKLIKVPTSEPVNPGFTS